MEEMPDEVLLHIFKKLEPKCILNSTLVCQRFVIKDKVIANQLRIPGEF